MSYNPGLTMQPEPEPTPEPPADPGPAAALGNGAAAAGETDGARNGGSPLLEPRERARFLAATDLFGGLDGPSLAAFAEAFEVVPLPGGSSLDCRGLERDSLYLVVSGRVRATLMRADGQPVVLELGRGKFCGELTLLGAGPRNATLFAVRDSELLAITHPELKRVAIAHPEALWELSQVVIARMSGLIGARKAPDSPVINVACLPLTDAPEAREVIRDLGRALAREGSTKHLTPEWVHANFGSDGASIGWKHERNSEVSGRLSRLEEDHRYVLYEATAERDEWTLRCLRQADRIVVVAPAGTEPDLDTVRKRFVMEDRCCISEVRVDALLYHSEHAEYPRSGEAWRAEGSIQQLHHVRQGDGAHYGRVARMLTNRALGVVLGGGGARGIAQVGAFKALEEAGLAIDRVGGTSMGSIFAAGFAMGWDADEILARVREVFKKRAALIDVTFPYLALLSGAKLTRVLQWLFGSTNIENLWHEYYCVSVSLNGANINVHDRGPVWRHIRSSCALPGIFPPVYDGDDVLIDGGVMNNLPTDVMFERAAGGPVIAIDVSGAARGTGAPFDTAVSGWRQLGARLNPFVRGEDSRSMHIFDVLLGSTVVSSRWKRNEVQALGARPRRAPSRPTTGRPTVRASSTRARCWATWRWWTPVAGDAAVSRPA